MKYFSVSFEVRQVCLPGGPPRLPHGLTGAGGGGGAGGEEARGPEGLVQHGPEDGEGLQGKGDAEHGAVLEQGQGRVWGGGSGGRGVVSWEERAGLSLL